MLEVRDIYKTYENAPLLNGVSFTAAAGEIDTGVFGLVSEAHVWFLQRLVGLGGGYHMATNINRPDDIAEPMKTHAPTHLQRTFVEVLLTPFGPDLSGGFGPDAFNKVEIFTRLGKLAQIGDSETKIGPNNWPANLRGVGPDIGSDHRPLIADVAAAPAG